MKAMRLRTQIVVLQTAIVLSIVLATGFMAAWMQQRQIREASQDRMVAVAQSVAQLPAVLEAYDDADPSAVIQPIAEVIREASNVTYVVVTDDRGIRFSHPNPERIGEVVSTDPSVALSGEMFVGTETGTLGESWRVKVPVFGEDDRVMGQVSVGILESELQEDFLAELSLLGAALAIATIIGMVASTGIGRMVRRKIYGLEPDEIRSLLETREATLHGIREGLLAFDGDKRVSLCNDAAARLLGLSSPDDAVGRALHELVDADLDDLLATSVGSDGEETSQRILLAGERVLLARAAPVRVSERPVGTVVILMDRTEVDHALHQLAGAQSLTEGLRAQQHEFANTLHTIGGLIELGESEAALQMIDRTGDGGPMSELDSHEGVHDLEVAALIMAKKARAKELGVQFTVAADSSLARGGPSELVTIVGNLVDNAIDAVTPRGRVELAIRSSATGIEIVVDDDGPGVQAENRTEVFRLGYSTKLDERPRGYGLTLVGRVVDRLGGRTEVSDSPWNGARFAVYLPITAPTASGAIARAGAEA